MGWPGHRLRFALAGVALLLSSAACGRTIAAPSEPTVPALPTPTPVQLMPPPADARSATLPEECGSFSYGLAEFAGHFNASDGQHYHRWAGPAGLSYWVVC